MVGITYELAVEGIEHAAARLKGLAEYEIADLAFDIGALLESSTKERIATEKRGPDGTPWPAWSAGYASTRGAHHSLLMNEGNLLDSIQNFSIGDEVRVGTPLVYGAILHEGGEGVGKPNFPARPYLGISVEDEAEIRELVIGDIREVMQ